jgi:hypothetical protein
MVTEGSKTLPMIYRKALEEIRSNRSIYGKSRIRQKFKPQSVDHHGHGAAWGPPLDGRTMER